MEPIRFPQLFLGLLLKERRSAIGQLISLSLVKVPAVFAKVNSIQFPLVLRVANKTNVLKKSMRRQRCKELRNILNKL